MLPNENSWFMTSVNGFSDLHHSLTFVWTNEDNRRYGHWRCGYLMSVTDAVPVWRKLCLVIAFIPILLLEFDFNRKLLKGNGFTIKRRTQTPSITGTAALQLYPFARQRRHTFHSRLSTNNRMSIRYRYSVWLQESWVWRLRRRTIFFVSPESQKLMRKNADLKRSMSRINGLLYPYLL